MHMEDDEKAKNRSLTVITAKHRITHAHMFYVCFIQRLRQRMNRLSCAVFFRMNHVYLTK